MIKRKLFLIALVIIVIILFLASGSGDYFTVDYFKLKQADIAAYFSTHPTVASIIFMAIYIILTSLSLPVAGIMTLISGAIFGFVWGLVMVSIASSIGATLAFLLSRYLFRDVVQRRYADRLASVNEGIRNDGVLYLFMLRMLPVIPYFMINATMALTPMRAKTFFPVTLVGMLLPLAIFVNAGMQISKINTMGDILSPRLIVSLALIGIFPLLVKKSIAIIRQRKATTNRGR